MKINEINTPAILLNLDYMEHNLKKYCGEAKKYGKEIKRNTDAPVICAVRLMKPRHLLKRVRST